MIVGLLHPGEMGAAVGAQIDAEVICALDGRSAETRERAASFRDVGSVDALLAEADVVVSICPPHAALDVARRCRGFDGIYVDANAISPMHATEIAELHPRYVDGSIIGNPPAPALYLSGAEAGDIAALFTLETKLVSDASAVKMVYAAWSKGTAAMLLAIRDTARHYGVGDDWRAAAPELAERLIRAETAAATKGWRWVGEMEEIADTFAAAGEPDGFHRAAAEVFRGMIEAHGLAKRFGDRRVFAGLEVEVPAGGFLLVTGANGSGKTTLLRILARLAAPSSGQLVLPARETIGYLGHDPLVYRELTALENLTLFARLYRVERERVGMLLERFGLWEVRNDRVSTFSRGMQQRLGLCRVLLHEPALLVLDEPSNALDAQGLELLDGVLGEERTFVVATHEPERVERHATQRLAFA